GAAYAVAAPGASAPSTASFTANDGLVWLADGGSDTATIAAGGTVTFSYPSGGSSHNVDFDTNTPTSCTQASGPDNGPVPPLPAIPTPPAWSGSCRFNTPGTYRFHCVLHQNQGMVGTVVVEGAGSTTGTTTPGGGSTSPTNTSGTTTPGSGNST